MKTNGKAPTFRTHHNTNTMNFQLTLVASSVLLGGALLTGCKGGETLTPNQAGEVEILEYCAGEEFRSDKNTFRATATGESMSREAAKKMARSNAEARLAPSTRPLKS